MVAKFSRFVRVFGLDFCFDRFLGGSMFSVVKMKVYPCCEGRFDIKLFALSYDFLLEMLWLTC